jgi:A/G-specific adenine glycosylase
MPRRLNLPRATVNAFQRDLLRWYRRHRRKLPWRGTRNPYRIWVSEIMLQQTRVETVRDYYRRWLRVFPTLASLARAPYSRVLKMWEGLGYYSRAKNLHRAAKLTGGKIPRTADDWLKLPGIGRYTAGAIASIAFGLRAPVVDGNVARVFARVFGKTGNEWEIAEALLPETNCGDFNQALMELGALVCVPANPRCEVCPLWQVCATRSDALPLRQRGKPRHVTQDVLFVRRNGAVLLRQRPTTGLLAGMWELPAGKSSRHLLTIRHAITDQQITLQIFAGKAGGGRWFTCRQLNRVTMPAAHRRALEQLIPAATVVRPRR